jgi:uncharacterized sporulation protein YeaH/YhbH (DUF444 family)
MFVWHDSNAMEVDEEKFYRYRMGGGTACSSAFKLISQQFENKFKPNNWNIYVFYFTDGDNWGEDNSVLIDVINKNFKSDSVNLLGVTQIYSYDKNNSVKKQLDDAVLESKIKNVNLKTYDIVSSDNDNDESRNNQILDAIKFILGSKNKNNNYFV